MLKSVASCMPISIARQGLREFYGCTWVTGPRSKILTDFGQQVNWYVHFLKHFSCPVLPNSENMYCSTLKLLHHCFPDVRVLVFHLYGRPRRRKSIEVFPQDSWCIPLCTWILTQTCIFWHFLLNETDKMFWREKNSYSFVNNYTFNMVLD